VGDEEEGPGVITLRALGSTCVLSDDGAVVARDGAVGPLLVGSAGACATFDNSSAFATRVEG
jgi:hypothetical protein